MKKVKSKVSPVSLVEQARTALNSKQYDKLAELCKKIVYKLPHKAAYVYQLRGIAAYNLKHYDKAEIFFTKALQLEKNVLNYHYLALISYLLSKPQEAIKFYLNALELEPNDAEIHNGLAGAYLACQQPEKAEVYCRKAIELNPHNAFLYKNLGMLLKDTKPQEAQQLFVKAVTLAPDFTEGWMQLGHLYLADQQALQAIDAYAKAQQWDRVQQTYRSIAKWDSLPEVDQKIVETIAGGGRCFNPLSILNIPTLTRALQKKAAQLYAHKQYVFPDTVTYKPKVTPNHNKRLKIGYLSADFAYHATMCLMIGVLEQHNVDEFEIVLYSYTPLSTADNIYTQRLANLPYALKNIQHLSDREAAELIADDGIDILIDLKGHTSKARLQILALRPAPIIMTWLGFPGTLGEPKLADYIIGDAIVTPHEHAKDYSEHILMMPHGYQPNDNKRTMGIASTRTEVGLPEGAFVFCSFNKIEKINPELFDSWCNLLKAVDNSVLWLLHEKNKLACDNLKQQAEARGVSKERIIFAPFVGLDEHLGRLQLANLALDTYPYNSHTTGSDALWVGVPLITKLGDTFASRVGASLLAAHGMNDLITYSDEEYFELAFKLATDKKYYDSVKQNVITNRACSKLFDTQQFTKDLEILYRKVMNSNDITIQNTP